MTEFRAFTERLDDIEAKLEAMEGLTGEPELSTSTGTSSSGSSVSSSSAPAMLPARAPPEGQEALAALAKEAPVLEGVREALGQELAQSMAKFQQRCVHIDPVTNKTLYGESMKKKVSEAYKRYEGLLARANALRLAVDVAVKAEGKRRAAEEERARREEEAAAEAKRLAEWRQQEEAVAEQEQRRAKEAREEEALGEAAARARELRKKEEDERAAAVEQEKARLRAQDEALVASVDPGVAGVEKALATLLDSCGGDRKAYKESVKALALYVGNVLAHPEEAAFKHIREANPLFKQKVGSRPGGVEALIAAGFTPQREEAKAAEAGVGEEAEAAEAAAGPVSPEQVAAAFQRALVMREPEVTDPAWTEWYDRAKAVRDRLQEAARWG